ncbi:MAG: FAD-dependent oxidoreductase [Burkholderiaceae bacterium]
MKRLVLVGGGHAHVHVLAAMAREPMPGVQAVLVTPFARQVYSGMVPGFVAGHYGIDDCAIPLEPLARAAQVELALSSVTAMSAAERTVTLADGRVAEYDVLSIDSGATQDRDAIAGARARGLFVRPIEHFVKLFDGVLELARERVLDVVVVGGGAAGFELAMAMQHRLGGDDGAGVRVCIVTGDTSVLTGFPAGARSRAIAQLRRARITVINQRSVEVGDAHLLLDNGARVVCDVPVMALPASAPAWLQGGGLALDERGFVATKQTLQSTSHAQVFAAGDVASRQDDAVPRSGVYAVRAGPALALNIRRQLAGGQLQPWLAQEHALYLLSCGARRAIAARGDWSAQGRWAWLWKDWIDRRFIRRMSTPPQPKR